MVGQVGEEAGGRGARGLAWGTRGWVDVKSGSVGGEISAQAKSVIAPRGWT